MKEITVLKNDGGQRLDKFLLKAMPKMPPSLVYKSLRKGRVRVNGKKTTLGNLKISEGDVLSLYINDEFFENDTDLGFLNAPDKLDVVYEDENILLVNKKAGLAVHDFDGAGYDTLINRIIHYLHKKGEFSPESENSFVPALCNRIDRNTCGMVIAAKNAAALREMNELIKNHGVEKKYLCICRGAMAKPSGKLTLYLKKNADSNTVTVSERPLPEHKTAITLYETVKKSSGLSLLKVTLKTGRTHQIRASLAHVGCPIIGDGKYGKSYKEDSALGFPYQALCSYYLKFNSAECETLSYLNGREFEISDIWFLDKI